MSEEIIEKEVACIILFDKDKRMLLQHRTEDARDLPGYWAFFGGKVEEGETPREAAVREVFEELEFVSIKPLRAMRQRFVLSGRKMMKNVFMEYCKDKSKLRLNEGQGWGWFGLAEMHKLKMVFHDREVVQYVDSKLQVILDNIKD